MWKIYGSPGAGVAIVSNTKMLESALNANPEKLFMGKVNYTDPSVGEIGAENYFEHIFSKLSSYSYESEVRLVH